MGNFVKLVDFSDPVIERGSVLRMPAQWPYENVVDFMVFENPEADRPYGLIVTSGYKGGLIRVLFPRDCMVTDRRGLSTVWVKDNWDYWIYPEVSLDAVFLSPGYSASLADIAS